MTSRSAPLWIVLFVALAAGLWWWQKPPAPPPPPAPVPTPPALSDLATVPDWPSLNRYQSTITQADFLRLMDDVFTVSPAWREWIKVGEQDAKIRTTDGEFLRLRFAPDGLASPPPRYWRPVTEMPPAPPDRPLDGVKIAIDPGHIGGRWGKMEERWFQLSEDSLPVQEGDMTLLVAKHLKPLLEALGATVQLVREETEPVTPIRPEMLEDEARAKGPSGNIAKLAERLFYRTAEIRARARLVNDTLRPDLVLCLHFNADEWGDPAAPTLVPANHFHMILNGGYTDDEVALADQRHDLLAKLLQGIHDEERKLAASAAAAFIESNPMPPYFYNPAAKNHRNVDANPYLWARNLLANRIYQCPVAYYEPYVMNSTEDYTRIQAGDYDGLREVAGKLRPSIFREYAACVARGLERHYQARVPAE